MKLVSEVIPHISKLDMVDVPKIIDSSSDGATTKDVRHEMHRTREASNGLAAEMMFGYTFTPDPNAKGVFAPIQIVGPRRIIKANDIKPGMANVGYIRHLDGRVISSIFDSVITEIKMEDGRLHVYGGPGESVVRDAPDKTWFIQHMWEHVTVTKLPDGNFVINHHNAHVGDYVLEVGLQPQSPMMRMVKYNADQSLALTNAHVGETVLYVLSPRLELPILDDTPIPPMPGEPAPKPAEIVEGDSLPENTGNDIPPMPGSEDKWIKPETKDWWIS